MPAPNLPDELHESIVKKRLALFVGAGLSRKAGFPDWTGLLDALIIRANTMTALPAGREDELKSHLHEDREYLLVAEELRDQMGEETFRDELATIFATDTQPTEAHKKLHQMNATCVITTNYDKLIEDAYAEVNHKQAPVYTYDKAGDVLDQLWRSRYFILKAHGTVGERRTMVVTRRDYRTLIYRVQGYRSLLDSIFNTRAVLFLGCGLRDPETEMLLGYLHDAFEGAAQRHFALMPRAELSGTMKQRWRKDYSVQCVEYDATEGHPEVEQFLDKMIAASQE